MFKWSASGWFCRVCRGASVWRCSRSGTRRIGFPRPTCPSRASSSIQPGIGLIKKNLPIRRTRNKLPSCWSHFFFLLNKETKQKLFFFFLNSDRLTNIGKYNTYLYWQGWGVVPNVTINPWAPNSNLSFYTFPFIFKNIHSLVIEWTFHTLLYFSFILQTFIIYLYILIFEDESLQDERKV